MQNKIIYNPKCKKCIYRSSKPHQNGCDYNYITGKLRDCPVENCNKFSEGDRPRTQEGIHLEKATEEDLIMSGYVMDALAKAGHLRDRARSTSSIAKR